MVTHNKSYYYFHLTHTGWVTKLPEEEIVFDSENTPVGSLLLIEVTEYSHDERPDVWHKAEIIELCEKDEKAELQKCFEQFPLPKLVEDKCWMQISQLRQAMLRSDWLH